MCKTSTPWRLTSVSRLSGGKAPFWAPAPGEGTAWRSTTWAASSRSCGTAPRPTGSCWRWASPDSRLLEPYLEDIGLPSI
ncbi:hypothetical protein [Pontibacter harenae]|uniref:hypothetical protein n=1 Tax=Pontibacter harenae TaxID=2894083 RepID=UPI001E2C3096|nr:hypothetical protein [Pontibacter harenae]